MQEQEGSGEREGSDPQRQGSDRWSELLRQGADWLAGAALRSLRGRLRERLRERLYDVAVACRRELCRVAVMYVLCRLLALFVWGAAVLGALAVLFAYWDGHRVVAALSVAGVFLLIAIACGIAVARLGRPRARGTAGGAAAAR